MLKIGEMGSRRVGRSSRMSTVPISRTTFIFKLLPMLECGLRICFAQATTGKRQENVVKRWPLDLGSQDRNTSGIQGAQKLRQHSSATRHPQLHRRYIDSDRMRRWN